MGKFVCNRCKSVTQYTKEEHPDFFVCPSCGSKIHFLTLGTGIPIRPSIVGKAFNISKTKWFYMFKQGFSLFRKNQTWHYRDQIFDKRNDYYREHVTDAETGKTVHFQEEPLSDHVGHGDDKKTKRNAEKQAGQLTRFDRYLIYLGLALPVVLWRPSCSACGSAGTWWCRWKGRALMLLGSIGFLVAVRLAVKRWGW